MRTFGIHQSRTSMEKTPLSSIQHRASRIQHPFVLIASLLLLVFSLQGCASKEEKRDQFLEKGIRLYEAGDYTKAVLEFKNALQLDSDFPLGYFHLGRTFFKQGNIKKAESSLSKALKLDEGLNEARLDLGVILIMAGAGEKALETIKPLLDKDPVHARALLIAARAYLSLERPEKAIESLEKIDESKKKKEVLFAFAQACILMEDTEKVKEYMYQYQKAAPDDPASYKVLSGIYAKEKQLEKAEDQIRKLIEQKKAAPPYSLLLCKFFLDTNQEERATAEFDRLTRKNAQENTYKFAYAEFLFKKKRFEQSRALLAEAVRNTPDSWQARDYLVMVYLAQAKVDDALKELNGFLQRDVKEGKIEALLKKGQILTRLVRWKEAMQQCDLALTIEANNPSAHLLKGKILFQKGNYDDAIIHLRQVVDIKPSEQEGYLFLARTLAVSGNVSLAIEELKRGLKSLPQNTVLRMELITYYQRQREWEKALEMANIGLEQQPENLSFLIQKGRMLTVLKKLDRGEKVFKSIIQSHSQKSVGYLELGRLQRQAGDYEKAIALFEKALNLKGDKATALTLLVETYLATKQEKEAEALCQQLLKEKPENAFLLATLGSIYFQQGEYQEAEKQFKEAIEVSPHWDRPHYGLVALYAKTNRLHEAADDLHTMYSQNPQSFRTGFTLSVIYQKLGQHEKAIALLEDLAARYPNVISVNNNLAYLHAEHSQDPEQLKKALDYAHKALTRAPENPQVLDTVAWVELKSGNLDRAMKYADSVAKGAEKDPTINYHTGLISARIGKKQVAAEYLSKAIELGLEEEYAKEAKRVLKTIELRE